MFRTTHYIAAGCLALGLTLLLNPPSAHARRPSTVSSKSYASGKFLQANPDISLTTLDDSDTTGMTSASNLAYQPNREPSIMHRPTMAARAYKPLHASLPHATKQLPRFAVVQDGR